MATSEIVASIFGQFEDFLRNVGKMDIFETLVYNYRLKPFSYNLSPEFTTLFVQLIERLADLKNNLDEWSSLEQFEFPQPSPLPPAAPAVSVDEFDKIAALLPGHLPQELGFEESQHHHPDFDFSHPSENQAAVEMSQVPASTSNAIMLERLETSNHPVIVDVLVTTGTTPSGTYSTNNPGVAAIKVLNEENRVLQPGTKKSKKRESKFLCQTCGKKYSTPQSLNAHLNVHTLKKKYPCKYCSKVFTRKDKMVFHESVHTGIKSFTCEICGKSFTRKTKLDEHLRRHQGVKKYKCNKCDKSYSSHRDLRNHLSRHRDSDPVIVEPSVESSMEAELPEAIPPIAAVDDEILTNEVSEIFKLNWPELQYAPTEDAGCEPYFHTMPNADF